MKSLIACGATLASILVLSGCNETGPSSDQKVRVQQEQLNNEGNMSVGMPSIKNFFEKRLLKTILEMRDDPSLHTYTYVTDMNGRLHLRCESIGYGIPYATQFTNPSRLASEYQNPTNGTNVGISTSVQRVEGVVPMADPNGLFAPAAAEGSWVLCISPGETNPAKATQPVYFEDRVTVSPFKLPEN